jgi:hypothetical protein
MTRRHFEMIAESIRVTMGQANSATRIALTSLAIDLADKFEGENPRFDRQRFLTACGAD